MCLVVLSVMDVPDQMLFEVFKTEVVVRGAVAIPQLIGAVTRVSEDVHAVVLCSSEATCLTFRFCGACAPGQHRDVAYAVLTVDVLGAFAWRHMVIMAWVVLCRLVTRGSVPGCDEDGDADGPPDQQWQHDQHLGHLIPPVITTPHTNNRTATRAVISNSVMCFPFDRHPAVGPTEGWKKSL